MSALAPGIPDYLAFTQIGEQEFNELIRLVRLDPHAKLTQSIVNRPGAERVTVYYVNGDPIAAAQVRQDRSGLDHFKRSV